MLRRVYDGCIVIKALGAVWRLWGTCEDAVAPAIVGYVGCFSGGKLFARATSMRSSSSAVANSTARARTLACITLMSGLRAVGSGVGELTEVMFMSMLTHHQPRLLMMNLHKHISSC